MKDYFRKFFSNTTNKTSYKKELLYSFVRLLILALAYVFLRFFNYLWPNSLVVRAFNTFFIFCVVLSFFSFFGRLSSIKDNIEKKKNKGGNKKFKFFRNFFSFNTDSISYKKELLLFLLRLLILSLVYGVLSILNYLWPNSRGVKILDIIFFTALFFSILSFLGRLSFVSDNKEKMKVKGGKKKFKFEPIYLDLDDFINWLKGYDEPETIYIQNKSGEIHTIEISFDVKGLTGNGKYYNKQYYINEVKSSLDDLIEFTKKSSTSNGIKILASFDNNSPLVVKEEIETYKTKKM